MTGGTTFASRIATLLAGLLVFSCLFVSLLNYLKFERLLLTQQARVLELMAVDVAETLERGINLGVRLPGVSGVQALLDRTWDSDGDIRRLSVVDSQGWILFDTDRARVGGNADSRLLAAAARPGRAGVWRRRTDELRWIGAPIVNAFGQQEGSLLLGHTRTGVDTRLDAIALAILRPALLVAAIVVPLVVLLTFVITAPMRRRFAALTAITSSSAADNAVAGAIGGAERLLDQAEQDLEALAAQVPAKAV